MSCETQCSAGLAWPSYYSMPSEHSVAHAPPPAGGPSPPRQRSWADCRVIPAARPMFAQLMPECRASATAASRRSFAQADRAGGRSANRATQCVPHRLWVPAAGRLLRLGVRRPLRRGPVAGRGHGQPVLGLHLPTGLPGPEEVVTGEHSAAVLPGQRRDDVDMVVGVPHGDPAVECPGQGVDTVDVPANVLSGRRPASYTSTWTPERRTWVTAVMGNDIHGSAG